MIKLFKEYNNSELNESSSNSYWLVSATYLDNFEEDYRISDFTNKEFKEILKMFYNKSKHSNVSYFNSFNEPIFSIISISQFVDIDYNSAGSSSFKEYFIHKYDDGWYFLEFVNKDICYQCDQFDGLIDLLNKLINSIF